MGLTTSELDLYNGSIMECAISTSKITKVVDKALTDYYVSFSGFTSLKIRASSTTSGIAINEDDTTSLTSSQSLTGSM